MYHLKISELAESLGKKKELRRFPNRAESYKLIWRSKDLPEVWEKTSALSNKKHILIDGPAPVWLVTCISHAVHPASVSIVDPKVPEGLIPIVVPRPQDKGKGIPFETTVEHGFTLVEFAIHKPVFDANMLDNVVPPKTPPGKGVVISGRGPNWLKVMIAMGYAHTVPWVGLFQPGIGATVTITHSPSTRLGEKIEMPERAA